MSVIEMKASTFLVKFQEQNLESVRVEEDVNMQNHSVSVVSPRILSHSIFNKLVIPDYTFQTLTIRHCQIQYLEISSAKYNLLHIHNCEISQLVIKDKNITTHLTIADNTIDKV